MEMWIRFNFIRNSTQLWWKLSYSDIRVVSHCMFLEIIITIAAKFTTVYRAPINHWCIGQLGRIIWLCTIKCINKLRGYCRPFGTTLYVHFAEYPPITQITRFSYYFLALCIHISARRFIVPRIFIDRWLGKMTTADLLVVAHSVMILDLSQANLGLVRKLRGCTYSLEDWQYVKPAIFHYAEPRISVLFGLEGSPNMYADNFISACNVSIPQIAPHMCYFTSRSCLMCLDALQFVSANWLVVKQKTYSYYRARTLGLLHEDMINVWLKNHCVNLLGPVNLLNESKDVLYSTTLSLSLWSFIILTVIWNLDPKLAPCPILVSNTSRKFLVSS